MTLVVKGGFKYKPTISAAYERGELRVIGVEALLEAGDLLADAAEEKHEPGRPVGAAFAPCRLRAAESEVVGFFFYSMILSSEL